MKTRTGESIKAWFRADRYYHTREGWWFQTRENMELGPFETQEEAEKEVALYLHRMDLVARGEQYQEEADESDQQTTAND